MRKLLLGVALVASIVTVLAVGVGSAGADGATVTRLDGTCNLNAGTIGSFACTVQRVETPSGEIHYWVKGQVDAGDEPDATLHVDNASTGQICASDAPDFDGVVTKSGNVNIQCRN
jgi:hypothetical protein